MIPMDIPNPLRFRYRWSLRETIGLIVTERRTAQAVLEELGLTEDKAPGYRALLLDELKKLEIFNCARYRLGMEATQGWIEAGRLQ